VETSILRDGYIEPQGRLDIAHSVKQKEYFFWKFNKLKKNDSQKSFNQKYANKDIPKPENFTKLCMCACFAPYLKRNATYGILMV
jgi:hypothetical protein